MDFNGMDCGLQWISMGLNGIQWKGMRTGIRVGIRWSVWWEVLECVVGSVGRVLGNVVRWKIVKRAAIIDRFISQEYEFNYQLSNDHVSLDQWLSIVDPTPETRVRFSA